MMKKATLAFTAASLLFLAPLATASAAPSPSSSIQYTDLQGHFAEPSILFLTQSGILKTDAGTAFAPDKAIERETFRTWLKTVSGVRVDDQDPSNKSTVLTRAEAAVWVSKALAASHTRGDNRDSSYFTDLQQASGVEKEAIGELYHKGILVGSGNHQFNPKQNMTRGEVAVLLSTLVSQAVANGQSRTFVPVMELNPTAYTMVEENKTQAGLYSVSEDGYRYIMVASGEKPSAGYGIEVTDVVETDQGLFVKVVESKWEGETAAVITYPYQVIKIKDTTKPIYLMKMGHKNSGNLNPGSGAVVTMMRQADLNGDGVAEKLAVVGTKETQPGSGYYSEGYLGLFNDKGELTYKTALAGEMVNSPTQLVLTDLNGDGQKDIVLDSDMHGNGGRGVHQMNVFLRQGAAYVNTPVESASNWDQAFNVSFDQTAKSWTIENKNDHRVWKAKDTSAQAFDPIRYNLQGYDLPAVDPYYEMNLDGNTLQTSHWMWSGTHANGIATLQATYAYKDGKIVISTYNLSPLDSHWTLTEQK